MKKYTALLIKQIKVTEKHLGPKGYINDGIRELRKMLGLLKTYVSYTDRKLYQKDKNGKAK